VPAGFSTFTMNGVTCTSGGGGSTSTSAVALVANSYASTCATLAQDKANASTMIVGVFRQRSDGQAASPVAAGTYAITTSSPPADTPFAVALVLKNDATCNVSPLGGFTAAISGTVTLTSVSGTISGSVDVTMLDGGRVTGDFSVAPCAVTQTQACDLSEDNPASVGSGPCVP
jgi:hypothetical protein